MRKPHAVVFPIPLQGHINPMMLLAKHLNSAGIRVTFLLTERTLSILQHNNNSKYDNGVAHEGAHDDDNYDNRCSAEGGMLPNNNNKHNTNKTTSLNDGCNNYNNSNNEHINNRSKPRNNGDDVNDNLDNIKNGNNFKGDGINNGNDGDGDNNRNNIEDNGGDNEDDDADNCNINHNGKTDHGVKYPDIKINTIHYDDNNGSYVDACDIDDMPPIQFEALPDPPSSHDHTLHMSSYVLVFLNSVPLLKRRLEDILERLQQKGHPATCIISDSFVPWTQDVANKFGIPRMEFWSSSVTVYAMGYHIPQLISRGYLPVYPGADSEFYIDIIPGLATFRLVDFFYDLNPLAIFSPVFDLISMAFSRAKEAQRVLVNSFYDLEKDITDALRAEGIVIHPIGPLLPLEMSGSACAMRLHGGVVPADEKTMSTSLYADDDDCLAWLDTQAEASVIYVSFGSMASISKEEMEELMLGLESSQQPYLLVLWPGMVSGGCPQIATSGKGRICGWAPQIQVLGHPAVGGFLTHCGWNSIMEGMYMGVPMIGCARESEQHTNMKCLRDEWKVAIGLDDNVCQGRKEATKKVEMKKELVERAVKAVMQEEEGVALRKRMQGLQEAAKRAAHHVSSLPLLIHHIKQLK